jgi:hypothetical protein
MATGSLNAQGVWIYGEDDSETTFSGLLNKLGTSVSTNLKGRIAQVVYASTNSQVNNSTGAAAATGLSGSITPTKSTSRIIVLVNQNGIGKTSQSNTGMNLSFNKSTTQLARVGENLLYGPLNDFNTGSASYIHTEIAGTTSSINYNTTFWATGAAGTVNVQRDGSRSTMMIIEVTA